MKLAVKLLLFSLIASVFLVLAVSGAEEKNITADSLSTILTAQRTGETITIDGNANESSWSSAPKLIVPVFDGKIGNVEVEMQALYDSDYIYMHVFWPDKTKSDTLFWVYNGSSWIAPNTTNQDIIAIYWNIDESVEGFDIAGCAITCHADRMHTNSPKEKVDMWKWMAVFHNPAGYAMDRFLDNTLVIGEKRKSGYSEELINVTWQAHKNDNITGEYVFERKNTITKEGKFLGPKYYKPNAKGEEADYITMEEVKSGRAVELQSLTKLNDESEIPAGFRVPAYISEKPQGSAGDIDAKGVFSNGWHLELKRKLKTGYKDDVQFDTAKTYRFSIAVNDDARGSANFGIGQGHSISLVAKTLEFGGIGSKEVADLALVRDFLTTAKAHTTRGEAGLALSTASDAFSVFNRIRDAVAEKDPELYFAIRNEFFEVRKNPSLENINSLIQRIDDATLAFQGKRTPKEPTFGVKVLTLWGKIQFYAFALLALIVIYPVYRMIKTSRKKELRHMSVFVAIMLIPIFTEGVGRIGVAFNIPLLQMFSFTSSEYMTLLWAIGMFIALYIGRVGFNEVDNTLNSLEQYSAEIERKMEELRKSQEQLLKSERLASIGQLAAGMAHELRNPLGVMKNASYYLNMTASKDDEKIKKHLSLLETELDRANKIITDLLEFSIGRKPALERTEIMPIISDALSRVAIPDNVKLKLSLSKGMEAMGDKEQLQRVFLNIILNALQAMPEGGELEISSMIKDGYAVISFRDTGTGIPEKDIEKIFEPLFTTKAKGIGLGLALTKQTIEAHQGRIEVESSINKGTTFRVLLPVIKEVP